MLIALIAVAAVAIGLLVLSLMTRKSAAEFRAQAEAREAALIREREQLTEARSRLTRELESTRGEVTRLEDTGAKQTKEIRALTSRLEGVRKENTEQSKRIEAQSSEITALVADNNSLQTQVSTAEAAVTAAEAVTAKAKADAEESRKEAAAATGALEAARAEAAALAAAGEGGSDGANGASGDVDVDVDVVISDEVSIGAAANPATLWDLELTRSERTWRNSVAADPTAEHGPFEAESDPVRLAVEIEAAALRENVGAFITVDWQAGPVDDPARRHLVVRVAQEMLEAAARSPEPSRLVATGTDEISLRLLPADTDDEVINIVPPVIDSALVDIRRDEGLSVTVKAP